ncbi:hypothetical protein ACNIZR_33040, partial [Pseudomonas japonica]
ALSIIEADDDSMVFNYRRTRQTMDLFEATNLFNIEPSLRARVAARNADSIAYSARSIAALR